MMQRDMELVRELLENIAVSGMVDANEKNAYHLDLMVDAGMVEPVKRPHDPLVQNTDMRLQLTEAGREFLQATHNEQAWNYVTKTSAHMGGMAFYTAREILLKYSRSSAG